MQLSPWITSATATVTPPFGRVSLAGMEWALTALEELRLPPHPAARAVMMVNTYVQGSAAVMVGGRESEADDDPGAADDTALRALTSTNSLAFVT